MSDVTDHVAATVELWTESSEPAIILFPLAFSAYRLPTRVPFDHEGLEGTGSKGSKVSGNKMATH